MLFSSFTFIFNFLPAVALAFAAARLHSPRAGILVLLAASLIFYGAWNPIHLVLFAASIGANFSAGLLMEDPSRRRAVGIAAVALNLAVLGVFKYAGFFLDTVEWFAGRPCRACRSCCRSAFHFSRFNRSRISSM